MENPSGEQWQDHLLSESQLSNLLSSLDTETAMQVLQRQIELRAQQPQEPEIVPPVAPAVSDAPVFEVPSAPVSAPTSTPVSAPAPMPVEQSDANPVPSFSFPWDTGVSQAIPVAEPPSSPAEPVVIDEEREAFIRSLEEIDAPKAPPAAKPSIWDETASQPIAFTPPPVTPAPSASPAPVPQPPVVQTPVVQTPVVEPPEVQGPIEPVNETTESENAEQAVTEYEEEHQVPPQPNLVDDVILEVGGIEDEPVAGAEPLEPASPEADPKSGIAEISTLDSQGHRPSVSLLATWNGSGALLGLGTIGYLAGTSGLAFNTLAVGAFVALVMTGVGFSVAALAARRGRDSQQVLSRAAFGVIGNIAPATFMVFARLAATAVVGLVLALGILEFTPLLSETVALNLGGSKISVSSAFPILAAAVLLAFGLSLVRGQARFVLSLIFAILSVLTATAITTLGYLNVQSIFALTGAADGAQALGIASSIMVLLGLLWGSAAVDENTDLRRGTMGAKLLANGIFNWIFIGGLALVSGFALTKLTLSPILELSMLVMYAVLLIALLSHLIARNAASLSGLGIRKVGVGSHLIVVFITLLIAVALLLRLGTDGLWYNLLGYLPVIGVPVIAWLGIFGADTLLRRRDYHEVSLQRSYGFYGKVNWFNLLGWLVATAAGLGLIRSSLVEFSWLGYLTTPLNLAQPLIDAQLGVWVALFLGALFPVIFTIPRVRNQERETEAIESRRTDLVEVLGDFQ